MIRRAVIAAGLVAGIACAAGPAPAAMAASQPFSLSVSPGRLAAGAAGSVRKLVVTNHGAKPVTVRVELTVLARNPAGRCSVAPLGGVTWATAMPLSFTLRPGGHRVATLTIGHNVPAGLHDLVAAFVAVPGQGSGVTVSGAVGAQMQVQGHGAPAATHPCLALAAPRKTAQAAVKPARGTSWVPAVIAALLLTVIVLLLTVIFRQRRRMRANTPGASP